MPTEKLRYRSLDGTGLVGVVETPAIRPKGRILVCHGISGQKDGKDGTLKELAEKLAGEGYRVLRFDFRGHGESERKQEEVTMSGWASDLAASVEQLAGDGQPIGLFAFSLAGASAVLYTAQNQSRVRSLVLWSPVLNLKEGWLLNGELAWGMDFEADGGYAGLKSKGFINIQSRAFRLGPGFFAELDTYQPYQEIGKITCPVLTIHSSTDESVAYSWAAQYGKPNAQSEFVTVRDKHAFVEEKELAMTRTLEWFKRHLQAESRDS